ncbi:DUF551 domain-containing protein [Salmonella enterica]|nr:DUF551 domain-containing protein [Salmonella enterica]EDJ1603402.1 DUF551 domain-containing protein [Salmonella enterica]EDK4378294.1 DUF551 domain-containing protein [Salmonella enterica]EDK9431205.1 DUF551 domain-containing protein [Salmonella enterica]
MTTITKERIELFIKNPLENGLTRGEQMELARIAMASLEAEPIGAFHIADQQVGGTSDYIKDGEWPIDNGVIDVYAVPPVQETGVYKDMLNIISLLENNEWAEHCTSTVLGSLLESEITRLVGKEQPAPVVPEEMPKGLADQIVSLLAHNIGDKFLAQKIWNACRAAMLQGAEPVSNHDELALYYLQGQKDGLEWAAQLAEANHPLTGDWLYDDPLELAKAIRKGPDMPGFAGSSPVTQDGWISCSERMPIIGELNWRTSFPLLITCEIGVIPAYYGFVRVNGNKHYGFMESLKYGDDSGNHPQTNEYDLISNVTHWMPLPEPPQEVNRG